MNKRNTTREGTNDWNVWSNMKGSNLTESAVQKLIMWPQNVNDVRDKLEHGNAPLSIDIVVITSVFIAASTVFIQWRGQPVAMESFRRFLHSWISGPLSLLCIPPGAPVKETHSYYTSSQRTTIPASIFRQEDKLKSKVEFIRRVGSQYGYATSKKGFIDDWRHSEFPTLIAPLKLTRDGDLSVQNQSPAILREDDTELEVYLDYAGSALPTKSQLSRIYGCNSFQILANPHSLGGGVASDRSWKLMQVARTAVMKHFGIYDDTSTSPTFAPVEVSSSGVEATMPNEIFCSSYRLVFTSGATDSLRLVAERFPWSNLKFSSSCDSYLSLMTKQGDHILSKVEADEFRFQSLLVYPQNVHTSVIGMRNVAMARGARFQCISPSELLKATPEWFRMMNDGATKSDGKIISRVDKSKLNPQKHLTKKIWLHHLLVLPLECNFGGDRFNWNDTIAAARSSSSSCTYTINIQNASQSEQNVTVQIVHKWNILFDLAKAAATSPVHLPTIAPGGGPDYAVLSFYKLFGLPTGLGCLFIKTQPQQQREKQQKPTCFENMEMDSYEPMTKILVGEGLIIEMNNRSKNYFGGGSVDLVLPRRDFTIHRNAKRVTTRGMHTKVHDLLEGNRDNVELGTLSHGTEHFRGIADLAVGFQEISDLGGMQAISSHSTCLAAELVRRFRSLVHDNNSPVVQIYGQWSSFQFGSEGSDGRSPGPTVAFNVADRDGSIIGYDEVSRLATLNRPPIQLRTGCFCNPGACQDTLSLGDDDIIEQYALGHVCGDRRGIVNGKPTGAIRASFGKDSLWEDVDALASFIEKVFVSRKLSLPTQELNCNTNQSDNEPLCVAGLFVFPIKSCAAMRVRRWPVNRCTGKLAFDREFALIDSSGAAMRLHSYPKMSQIESTIDLERSIMTVTAPGHVNLVLSLDKSADSALGVSATPRDVEVCGALCTGKVWGGPKASSWFSSVLGIRCWLARHCERVDQTAIGHSGKDSYSNEAALLVVSQRSISLLNSVIVSQGWGQQVDSRHFRPNIVISTLSSDENNDNQNESVENNDDPGRIHPEDSWTKILISCEGTELELSAIGKCARCQMVDIDPTSGMKGNTLRALAQYRRERGKIHFGTFFAGIGDESIDKGDVWLAEGCTVNPILGIKN